MQLIEFFDRGVTLNPGGPAFVSADRQESWNYREAADLTHRIAAALTRDGFGAEAPVAVLSPNSCLMFGCVLGIARAGCAWVQVNARSTAADVAAFLQAVDCEALLFASGLADVADDVRSRCPDLRLTVAIEGEVPGAISLPEWLAPEGATIPLPKLDPEAIVALNATGGTTGRPKAVEVPNRAMETMIHGFNAHMPERNPVHLVAAPMTHAAGAAILPVLSQGGVNVVHNGVVAADIFESIERNQVTRLFLPPTAIYTLLAHPDSRTRDLSSLRYFLYAAAPMSVDKLIEAMEVFGPVMTQCFGQAEAPMLCTFMGTEEHAEAKANPALRHRLASCGRSSLVADVRIMDEDDQLLGLGERGEIVVRSSLTMRGYRGDEQSSTLRPGDWHGTGDVGYIDEDGYVYIVDRARDVIISGGFNVFPSEVEQVIWSHPSVFDCAVIGLPDEKWGERVTAVVELKDGERIDGDALIALCKERLGSVKAPKQIIVRDLPRSHVGKVLKRDLREEYWAERVDRKV